MRLPLVAALSAAIAAATLSPALAQEKKTAKACQEEWRANKADYQAKGITEKAYVAQCRTGAAKTDTPAAKPETPSAKTPPATSPPADKPAAPAPSTTAALATGEYATEAEAKGKCGSDLVVWVNLDSKIYHYAGNRNYGKTKQGAYMCEKAAVAAGMRASKTEKRPGA
jgi:hypothetical protein